MLKYYVILYTCTIMTGIILDLVKDAYTKALHTFIARGGHPNVIPDNGKVFSADETQPFCSNHFAPWQGAFWERLVSLYKRCFKKVFGKGILCYIIRVQLITL